jgi:hypothetical protein
MGVSSVATIALSLIFGFGTIVWFSAQVGTAWHFAHVVAIFFTLVAIAVCQRDGPTWLIGVLMAAATLSRLPVAAALPFFGAYVVDRAARGTGQGVPFGSLDGSLVATWPSRLVRRRLIGLAVPMALGFGVPILCYLVYNAARFGSPLENGYALIPGVLAEAAYTNGIFGIANIPSSVWAMLLATPPTVAGFPYFQPPRIGPVSILLTTPAFLWAFRARRPDWFNLGAWTAIGLILIPILTHGGTGDEQFGYRFAQDFYPFLFLLMVRGFRGRPGVLAVVAVGIGLIVNAWGMAAAHSAWWA